MKITLVPYNPGWPEAFKKESSAIDQVLGEADAQIEHIGSTAVEGLVAKPIIDIMIGLDNFEQVGEHIKALENLGYQYHPRYEDLMPYRRYFDKTIDGLKSYHLHMVVVGTEFWNRHLLFRDHLRNHPEDKALYAALKTELAHREWKDGNDYAAAKTEFIRAMEKKAADQPKS